MEERFDLPVATDELSELSNQQLPVDQSKVFIGQWNRLVSTTNWEKGQIIYTWRQSLIEQGASRALYSDEAWARMVGDVTPQHVGRLRRTHERFGDSHQDYEGLYWSHFYAGLEWDDAEMWLEGAVQNRWSVSNMRRQRWETLGKIPEHEPRIADVVVSEIDEGFQPLQFADQVRSGDMPAAAGPATAGVDADADSRRDHRGDGPSGPRYDEPDFGDEPTSGAVGSGSENRGDDPSASQPKVEPERIFENLSDLPEDVAEATEAMKLAILRHKLSQWADFPHAKMIDLLDALRQLAGTPDDFSDDSDTASDLS